MHYLKLANNKALNLAVFLVLAGVFLFLVINNALAQTPNLGLDYVDNIGLESTEKDIRVVLADIVRYLLGFVGLIAVVMIMYSGWLWMSSQGEEAKVDRARKTLVRAAIGLLIVISSFLIVTYVVNLITGKDFDTGGSGSGKGSGADGGIGALGNCSIESVYPEPGQKEVPRNVSIVVTFREDINPATICDDANANGACDPGEQIIPEHVRIYKALAGDSCATDCSNNVVNVSVSTVDNRTFVLSPNVYLGSPSEYIDYAVYLSNDIEKQNGDKVFDNCRTDFFRWQFEVSNRLDLTPPQVNGNGVFPSPDDSRDTQTTVSAVQAGGSITVNSVPQEYVPASISAVTPGGTSPAAVATANPNSAEGGILTLAVLSDGISTQLRRGALLLGSAPFIGTSVSFPSLLTLTVTGGAVSAGNSWDIAMIAKTDADTLRVDSINYRFVSTIPGGNEIQIGSTPSATALNIANTINKQPAINAAISGNTVNVLAATAGDAGNSIILSADSSGLLISPASGHLEGGVDASTTYTPVGKKDKPRNAVIQINFNEAVNPLTLSGNASDIDGTIAVVCQDIGGAACNAANPGFYNCPYGVCLKGRFTVSNQYQTVEFISDNLCGANSCGEEIYCLPGNSHLSVRLNAATLDGCVNCAARAPFTDCSGGHCFNSNTGENYPLALAPLDGIADMALNSFDGDRSGDAEGPVSDYNENDAAGGGDNFIWSFYISDELDISAPIINLIQPVHDSINVPLSGPISIRFNKLMLSQSLRTGSVNIFNGTDNVKHYLLNLINLGTGATGYWIAKANIDIDSPPDGEGDITEAYIEHGDLISGSSYRTQAGSGLKDIYQNCYKPSSGPGCSASDANPSCCPSGGNIDPTVVPSGQSCP